MQLRNKISSLIFTLILMISPIFATQLEGNVWADNGCLGGPIGCPVPGATITASGGQNGLVTDSYMASANDYGHYAMELPSGYYFVSCSKDGWVTQEATIYIDENGASHDFYLPEDNNTNQNLFFSGFVFGNMGSMLPAFEHIAGAHVEIFGGNDWGFELYFETETNDEGYFEFEYTFTPGGAWFTDAMVKISAEGYEIHEEWINFSEPVLGHEFYLNPSTDQNPEIYFSGNVFANYPNTTGLPTPLHNVHVKLYGGFTGGLLAEAETNDDGYFEFGDVVMSAHAYSIEAEGYESIEGEIWDLCNTLDPSLNECYPIYSDFYLDPEENNEPSTAVLYGQVTAQMSPMGPEFPVAGATISANQGWCGVYTTESNENGDYVLEVAPHCDDFPFNISCTSSDFGTQYAEIHIPTNEETELNFHFNNFDNPNPSPSNLEAFLADDNLTAILEWEGVDANTGAFPMYNVYMQNNWHDDAEWFLLGTTGETRFEFQLAINTIIDNPCFKVTALYGGMESEPSNTACLEFDDGGDHVSAPYDLTAEFEPMPLGGIVYLNWYHGNANTDPSQSTTHFNVYVYYGWDDLEWDLVAETTTPHFEYMLGDFWWPEELCFKVTAVQNGNESEPSNIACAWDEPHPDPECEDLSDFHFGDCEMIIGIGYNGNECTWFSGCGTIDQFGNDHANSFFESVEECEATCDLAGGDDCDPDLECAHVVTCIDGLLYPTSCGPGNCDEPIDECDDGGDDGPPECLLDCPGIGDVNPEEDADATCQWIIEIVQPNSQCISDCDEETYGFLMELSGICEQCLNGAFDCADIFEDEEEENGVLYGNVEYVWGDAIELVANAHIRAERIGEDGVTIDVFETSTNEMGQYEISLPAGAYMVTASAYEDSETHDVYIEPMSENQLNFQLGEFYYPDIYALSGQVSGAESANGESYPLAGAQIRAVCLSSGDVFETTSGEEGYYWLHVAFPDLYEVTVTKDGYESFTQTFEIFGIIEANFMLYNGGGTDAEAFLSLGNSIGNQDGFTVPLFLHSNQPVGGLQFAVYPLNESWDYYFIPGELEVLDPCFSGDANDVYGQLWGIMFSLEGCAYEPGETHHVANLSFTVEGSVPAGTELPLTFNYTLVSDPDANEIPSAGEGSVVTFGQPGDVNGDGDVNVVDIVNMVNFALQVEEPTDYEFSAADLNNDGDINILDIVNVVNIILYGDDLQRFDTGDAEVYYKDKTIHIQGEHVAGFQIEFVDVVGVDRIQIPEGWTVNTHGNTIVAYNFDGDLLNGRSIIELNETSEISDVIIADAQGNMILAHVEALPQWVALKDNYPNPFNPQTTISYTLSHDAMVELSVYNLSGRMVESLVNGQQYPGEFSVSWTANGLPSGMYIARLIVDGESFTKKMMLMK